MRRLANLFLALSVSAGLTSCAPLLHEDCPGQSWYDVGYAAGEIGQPVERYKQYAELCASRFQETDHPEWLRGYQAGNAAYCTPENAYSLGIQGRRIYWFSACPKERHDELFDQFLLGAKCESLLSSSSSRDDDDDELDRLDPDYDPDRALAREIGKAVAEAIVGRLFDRDAEWDRLGCH